MIIKLLTVISADPGASSQWGAGGAAILLLTVAIGFIFRILYNLTQENKLCRWQIGCLLRAMAIAGVPQPPEFWEGPPDISTKRKKRLSVNFRDEEQGTTLALWLGGFLLVIIFVVSAGFIINSFLIQPLQRIQDQQATDQLSRQQDSCVADLTADYFVAVQRWAKALSTRPLERSAIDAGLSDMGTTAERIRERVKICSDGHPDEYRPAPELATVPPGM